MQHQRKELSRLRFMLFTAFYASLSFSASALSAGDDELQRMQKKLNEKTAEAEFSAPDPAAVETYIRDAMTGNMKPRQQPPSYWRDGYTCEDVMRHSRADYFECVYYYRENGHHWR